MGWCNPCPPGVPAGNFHLSLSWRAPASHCSPRNEAEKRRGQFGRPRGGVLVSCAAASQTTRVWWCLLVASAGQPFAQAQQGPLISALGYGGPS